MAPRSYITDLFGSSPIRPLQQHMAQVESCARELIRFVDAALAGDWETAAAQQRLITTCEHKADALKKDLRMHLPKGLFMPVSRPDVLEVLWRQDQIANKTKDIAGLMLGRRMQIPGPIAEPFRAFVARCLDAVTQAHVAVDELDELLDTGFSGGEVVRVEEMLRKLDAIESETDTIQVKVREGLFAIERDLPPVDVMFTYQIIAWVGDIADLAQQVGSRLQLMLAR
ncbi:TIGR00153 family protein [Ectothiorhodospiraceae bacterium 2226]|nr:TIGR00153 family protein [Ectothiorhodospiraceae bacterium 2226]